MLVPAGEVGHLRDLGFSNLVSKNSANTYPMLMHVQHDTRGVLARLVEMALKNVNNELHWRIVVVQQQDTVERWPLGLGLDLSDDPRSDSGSLITCFRSVINAVSNPTQPIRAG